MIGWFRNNLRRDLSPPCEEPSSRSHPMIGPTEPASNEAAYQEVIGRPDNQS